MTKCDNLKLLVDDMKSKGWTIDSFIFTYKSKEYIVLVKRYSDIDIKPHYSLVKLEFIHISKDNLKTFESDANSNGLMAGAKDIRDYFGIEFSKNMGNILNQFNETLGAFIPTHVIPTKSEKQIDVMVRSLSECDKENQYKIYCHNVRRNPSKNNGLSGMRSQYNDNKTRLLRPNLYEMLKTDESISFCYYEDPNMDRSDSEIIKSWTNNR